MKMMLREVEVMRRDCTDCLVFDFVFVWYSDRDECRTHHRGTFCGVPRDLSDPLLEIEDDWHQGPAIFYQIADWAERLECTALAQFMRNLGVACDDTVFD